MRGSMTVLAMVWVCAALALAQQSGKAMASAPAKSESVSGKQLYTTYCSMCHGPDAKGGGPFAPQLKVWPPDLTQLAKKNNGTYPEMRVAESIDGEFGKAAHGSHEMPIWGPVFRSMAHGRKDSAHSKIEALVKYLESVQQK